MVIAGSKAATVVRLRARRRRGTENHNATTHAVICSNVTRVRIHDVRMDTVTDDPAGSSMAFVMPNAGDITSSGPPSTDTRHLSV